MSCRARSARKLKKTTASPSRIGPTGSPFSMEDGRLDELVGFAAGVGRLRRPRRRSRPAGPDEKTSACVGARHAVPPLVAVHGVVAAGDGRDLAARAARAPPRAGADTASADLGGVSRPSSEGVDAHARHAAPRAASSSRPCEVALVGVHAAVGEEAHQVQRRALAPRVLARPRAAPGSRRTSRRAARGRCAGGPAGTMRPAPSVRCPTSELPITPAGSPTASPEASSSVHGYSASQRSKMGVRARAMALPCEGGAWPQPSQIEEEDRRRSSSARRRAARRPAEDAAAAARARKPALEVRQHVHEGDVRLVGRVVRREVRVHLGRRPRTCVAM